MLIVCAVALFVQMSYYTNLMLISFFFAITPNLDRSIIYMCNVHAIV